MRRVIATVLLVSACTSPGATPAPDSGAATVNAIPLAHDGDALARAAAIELDGSPGGEVVIAGSDGVAVLDVSTDGKVETLWQARGQGGATALAAGDFDGDGRDDVVVGWGAHHKHPAAPARLIAYRSGGAEPGALREELLSAPQTTRAQFGSLQVTERNGRAGVLAAYFVSKYDVQGSFISHRDDGWAEEVLDRVRMAAHWAAGTLSDGRPRIFVGRPYGDQTKSDGDVSEWRGPGARAPLPAVRGVRSLEVVTLGPISAPQAMVCYGAGWHWQYRDRASGVLTCATPHGAEWRSQVVDTLGSFEVSDIDAGDLDGDGLRELVVSGPAEVVAYTAHGPQARWTKRVLGAGAGQIAVVDLDGDGRDEVVATGQPLTLYRLP